MGAPYAMTLAEQTGRRLILAGYTRASPAVVRVRAWNTAVYSRAGDTIVPP